MIKTDRLLAAVRRRLRVGWFLSTAQEAVPWIAAAALGLVLLGWLAPWGWPEPAAMVVPVVALIALAATTFFVKISVPMAARAADRHLGVKDAFTAALQFRDHDRFGNDIVERAERFASTTNAREAVPWTTHPRRWAAAGLLGALAIGLAVLGNPQDDARAEAAITDAILADEAERLEDTAEAIRDLEQPSEAELAVAAELERLAEQLQELEDLALAEELLRDASSDLAPDSSAFFATKAAVQGLDQSLEAQPLPGTTGDAAEQLDQLAEGLEGLTDEETEALADRLDALAATQSAGNPAAAGALADAAQALRAGDSAGARAALGEASNAQQAGEGAVREGQVGQAGSGAASDAANRIAEGQPGQGSGGQGEGSGQGSGQGEGSGEGSGRGEGSGQGSGRGEGSGEGSGQGSGSGNPSGDVTGASGGQDAAGQGGQGNPQGRGDSTETGTELETPTLFDPGGASEELFPGSSAQGETETVGLGQGPTASGSAQVPLGDVLGEFERQAVAALDDPSVAPSQRALVQRYFDRLTGLAE